ncbi:hypothetical protein ACJRO7_030520 [Eucalyptus globulus]|uniref:Major facilitator superfamily (MFS) profile domain-containing protein n=2 Tax=Eucalyptus TaxID=3932 RepID=A0ABD3JEF3_EUCGL
MAISEDIENQETGDREGVRERLLVPQEKDRAGKDEGTNKGRPWMVYFTTFVAVCGSYEFGTCAGYSSPTQDAIVEELSLSTAEYSVFGSILTFGNDCINICLKMQTMRIASALCVAGWLAIYFAEGALVASCSTTTCWTRFTVPIFIAEITPKNLRGALTAVNQLMIVAGVSVSFIIGTVLAWRVLALIGLIPCAVLLFSLFFIPESPRWLAKTGHKKEFEAALQKLHGKDADISEEAAEIRDYIETLQLLPKASILNLFQRRCLSSVIIGVGLMVIEQFRGINGVCFYTSNIFEEAIFSSSVGTITYAILQVIVTAIGAALVDRAGRKPLLLISGTGLVLGCIVTALSFFLKVHDLAADAVPILAVTGILLIIPPTLISFWLYPLYIAAFLAGMGAVPWVVMSEIFPINIKGVAGGFATLVNWFGAWAVSYTFNYLMSWSSYGTFLLYAVINATGMVFMITVVPETKGRSLEQIQAAINRE